MLSETLLVASLAVNVVTLVVVAVKLGRWSGIVDATMKTLRERLDRLPCVRAPGAETCQKS